MTQPPAEPAAADAPPRLELSARVRLSHARIAHVLDGIGVRGLHVKGYAVEPGVYAAARSSSDVDLLVHPADVAPVMDALVDHGWAKVTDFAEGSIFGHAATLWHDHLGYVDVHRLFPGLGADPALTFERLWAERTARVIAGRRVPVPSLRHQRLVVLVHGARDAGRGGSDVQHLRETLTADEWAGLRAEAEALDALAAWGVATGEDVGGAEGRPEEALFQALRASESGLQLFLTRWRVARSARERALLVARAARINRPHLQMRLGRAPTGRDIARAHVERARAVAVWAAGKAVRRGG